MNSTKLIRSLDIIFNLKMNLIVKKEFTTKDIEIIESVKYNERYASKVHCSLCSLCIKRLDNLSENRVCEECPFFIETAKKCVLGENMNYLYKPSEIIEAFLLYVETFPK